MATRINTKFVLILVATVCGAAGIVGGLWVLQIRGDATRHITAGDAIVAEAAALEAAGEDGEANGRYEAAVKEYGRAVSKEPANLSHLAKVRDALLKIRPMTQDQANEYDMMRIGILNRVARYRPRDSDAHMELVRELFRSARWLDQSEMWQAVEDAAAEMLERVPGSEAAQIHGRLYRGLAQMRRMGYGSAVVIARTATRDEIDSALSDLVAFLKAVPDHDLGWATLTEVRLSIARQARTDGRRSAALFTEVDETMAQALEAAPDGPEVARVVALRLTLDYLTGGRPINDPQLIASIERMVDLVAQSDDPILLSDAGKILRTVDLKEGLPRAIALLQAYVSANPDSHYQRFLLADLYLLARNLDQASEHATAIIEARPVTVSMLSRVQHALRLQSAGLITDIEYRRWEQADEADKPAQLSRVEAARDQLAALAIDPDNEPLLLKAEGKIANARNDHMTAADRFERVLSLLPAPDFESLWFSSRALEQLGQIGLARKRLQTARLLQPRNVVIMGEQARLEYRMGLYDQAQATIDAVLELDEDNQLVARLKTAIAAGRRAQEDETDDPIARRLLAAQSATREGNLEEARSILTGGLDGDGDKLPVLTELIQIELRLGRADAAREHLDAALALQPNNEFLRKLDVGLSTDDQIEALKSYMAGLYVDEADRAVHTLIHLRALADELDRVAQRREDRGDAESAANVKDRARVASEEADIMLARAEELAPGHPKLLDYLFNQAVAARDWPRLEDLVERARQNNADLAGGQIFRGRYQLARGRYEEAIVTLTGATERKSYSSLAWRLLARAQERVGNFTEALEAYEQSYTRNPNDLYAIRWYVNLLMQTGARTRALNVLHAAKHTLPNDELLNEVRLELEADVGNTIEAMNERRRIHDSDPQNRTNSIRLAALLARAKPTYEHVLDDQGKQRYDADQWKLLLEKERHSLLAELEAAWARQSDEILTALRSEGGETVQLASLRAELLKSRGRIEEGGQVLQSFLAANPEEVMAYLALSAYQSSIRDVEAAVLTLEAARAYQTPDKRAADVALADLYFAHNMWQRSLDLYDVVATIRSDRPVQLRRVECLTKLARLDDAQSLLAMIVDADSHDYFTAMLQASIAEGQVTALVEAGLPDRAETKDAEVLAALEQAERLQPANPLPHVRRAQRFLNQYQRTGRAPLLNDALEALDRADRVQANAESTSRVRVEILRTKGDRAGAIGELTRLIGRNPANLAARRMLVQLLVERAAERKELPGREILQVVREAIELNPSLALWHESLGDVHVLRATVYGRAGDGTSARAEASHAAAAFLIGHQLQPSALRLAKYVELSLAEEQPDFSSIVQQIESTGSMLEGSPLLRALYALALTGHNREADALEQMKLARVEHGQLLAQAPGARRGLESWLGTLQLVMADEDPGTYERLVRELAGGELDPIELVAVGRTWVKLRGSEGVSHALELLSTAGARCKTGDDQVRAMINLDAGQYHVMLGDYQKAADDFVAVLEIDPDHPLALNNAAYIFIEHLDDPARAIPFAERGVEVKPGDPFILDTLGWALCRTESYDKAEQTLRESIAAKPSADNHLHLAWVFYQTDRGDKARDYLRYAAELKPGPDTQEQIEELAARLRR